MVATRVPVSPDLFGWAADRSGRTRDELDRKFPQLGAWENGERQPTFRQLEDFARATFTPFGTFFLAEPPADEIPIPDFRTVANQEIVEPSPDLLETIFICERRQEWYRQYALSIGAEPLSFIGSSTLDSSIEETADEIREALQFTADDRVQDRTWDEARRRLIDSTEDAGILVMVSGIVAANTSRTLDPDEFRGFVLSDPLAPLIFINAADTKAAQIFTLVHEVCHLWLGQSAVPAASMDIRETGNNPVEIWCNQIAAEVLIPMESLRNDFRGTSESEELDRLAKKYKVSTLVVLKRIFDAGLLDWHEFRYTYRQEHKRVVALARERQKNSGGDYYNVQPLRVSRRFAKALIDDTLRGRTLHRDAFRLLGTKKHDTFVELGRAVGVV